MASDAVAEEIDVQTAHAMWAAGDIIIDVRLPEEYADGHIPGAMNVPMRELPRRVADLPAGHLITVCSMGNRSLRAAEQLARLHRTTFSIRGGTKQWAAAGYPVVAGAADGSCPRHRGFGARVANAWRAIEHRLRRILRVGGRSS